MRAQATTCSPSDTGSIREGYLADLVVISPDPFGLPASELHAARVEQTWIGGHRVHDRSTTASAPAAPDMSRES